MKNMFRGFIKYTEEEFYGMWEKAHFVVDTNILLNFFKYTKKDSYKKFFDILEELKKQNKLFIPHQVALEYFFNYRDNIDIQSKAINQLVKNLNETKGKVTKHFNEIRSKYPYLEDEIFKFYLHDIEISNKTLETKKTEFMKQLPNMEEVHEKILSLMDGIIGRPYTQDEINKISEEGAKRYKYKVPPGWEDDSEKDGEYKYYADVEYESKYGDLIIWKQMIDYSKNNVCSLIFISEDSKEDWWIKDKENKRNIIGIQPNLIQEFFDKTESYFYMYRTDRFVQNAVKYLKLKISDEAVEEIAKEQKIIRIQEHTRNNEDSHFNVKSHIRGNPNEKEFLYSLLFNISKDKELVKSYLKNFNLNSYVYTSKKDIENLLIIIKSVSPEKYHLLTKWMEKVKELDIEESDKQQLIQFGTVFILKQIEANIKREIEEIFELFKKKNINNEYIEELYKKYHADLFIEDIKYRLHQELSILDTLQVEYGIVQGDFL